MRILVVTQYFWPETFRINEVVAYLTADGHEVTVLTGRPNYPAGKTFPEFLEAPHTFANYAGAEIVRVPLIPRGQSRLKLVANYLSFVGSGLLVGAWKLRGRKFDVVLAPQLSPVTSVIPAIMQRYLKKAPLVIWILDLWPETLRAVNTVKASWALNAIGKLVAYIYNRCDCILVQSRAFIPSIRKRTKRPLDIRYFPAWPEEMVEPSNEDVEPAPEFAPYADTFNVVFAGNVGEGQDMPTVLQAAAALKDRSDIRWIIVGDGRAAASVRAEIERLGLERQVIMLGRHPLERMPSFFKAAGALLVSLKPDPVFAMTVPGKVQSYLNAGVPIVAMLDGEGARVIEEAGAGLTCRAGDSAGLARAVCELAGWSAEQRAAASENARAYCHSEFDRTMLLARLTGWLAEFSRKDPRISSAGSS